MMRNFISAAIFISMLIWPGSFWKLIAIGALYFLIDIAESVAVIKARSRYGR